MFRLRKTTREDVSRITNYSTNKQVNIILETTPFVLVDPNNSALMFISKDHIEEHKHEIINWAEAKQLMLEKTKW